MKLVDALFVICFILSFLLGSNSAFCKSSEIVMGGLMSSQVPQESNILPQKDLTKEEKPLPLTDALIPASSAVGVLTYDVKINYPSNETIDVKLTYDNLYSDVASFSFCAGSWWDDGRSDQKESILLEMNAFSKLGDPLTVTYNKKDSGIYVFSVKTDGNSSIEIKYKVNIGFWANDGGIFQRPYRLGGYVSDKYCVIEPGLLFLTPTNLEQVSDVRVSFDLPYDWNVVTFWEKEGGYYRGSPSALRMTKGPFGFGNFTVEERVIGETKVIAAAAEGVAEAENVTNKFLHLYDYYRSKVFGDIPIYTYTDANRDGYIAIFVPASDAFYNLYHEEYGLYMSLQNQNWGNLAHMLCHNWTEEQNWSGAGWYVTEGFVEYLQVKITEEQGYLSSKTADDHMSNKFNWYKSIEATESDISLEDSFNRIKTGQYDNNDIKTQYDKGALVALILDETLLSVSKGDLDIIDLMQAIFNEALKVRDGKGSKLDGDGILKVVNSMTGYDFSDFFQLYFFGTAQLPLTEKNGSLTVDLTKVPNLLPTILIDIRANGLSDTLNVTVDSKVSIEVELSPGEYTEQNADWWVLESTPSGTTNYYNLSAGAMVPGLSVTHQGPLFNLSTTNLLNSSDLSAGTHTFYFGVDLKMNGSLDMDSIYYDWVTVNVTGP